MGVMDRLEELELKKEKLKRIKEAYTELTLEACFVLCAGEWNDDWELRIDIAKEEIQNLEKNIACDNSHQET